MIEFSILRDEIKLLRGAKSQIGSFVYGYGNEVDGVAFSLEEVG